VTAAGPLPEPIRPVVWSDGVLRLLDQRRLPDAEAWLECRTAEDVAEAVRRLAVRGAPAIGIAGGFGVALAAAGSRAGTVAALVRDVERRAGHVARARPTAVNLSRAVDRVLGAVRRAGGIADARRAAVAEAARIAGEEERAMIALAGHGAPLVPPDSSALTHCNTGALACGAGFGTALGMLVAAHRGGIRVHVWVPETRPVLQGARLTAWELRRLGVPMTLVADTVPGSLMAAGRVDLVTVGADRIAANGDVANKIGTYQLAVLARAHGVPFYVAAPTSTIDPGTLSGADVAIETRPPDEVTEVRGVRLAPDGTPALNPAFDVTPARLVTAIVTERGVVRPPYRSGLRRLLETAEGAA
jgi:methylthioribose-1-phosphate isomerase